MWLNAAYSILETEGVEQIRVERLGRMLGLTKGSFYGQFSSRDELLQALLQHWRREMLDWLNVARANRVDDLAGNLRFILTIVEKNSLLRFDNALRVWAKQQPAAARIVEEIDEARIAYLLDVFETAGIKGEDARTRAEVFYGYTIFLGVTRLRPFGEPELLDRVAEWIAGP